MSPRYESTSSEEEEEGSSSDESGDGECLDSTEEEAALEEEDTSEEERNVNLDESDTDEETMRGTSYSSDAVKEKCVLSVHTVAILLGSCVMAVWRSDKNVLLVSGLSLAQKCVKLVWSWGTTWMTTPKHWRVRNWCVSACFLRLYCGHFYENHRGLLNVTANVVIVWLGLVTDSIFRQIWKKWEDTGHSFFGGVEDCGLWASILRICWYCNQLRQ